VGMSILSSTDTLVAAAARSVTRRRFLRNSGAAALGVALAATGTSTSTYASGTPGSPCGPSPICPDVVCNSTYNCDTDAAARRRNYATFDCASDTAPNCWLEDYTNCGGTKWKCCDCCGYEGTGSICSGCNATKRACICKSKCSVTDGCSQWGVANSC
jgi:hypothetical protein